MMNLTALPKSFWGYALESVNMVPTKKGCEALVKRDMPDKLESRFVKCIFVGYLKETMRYYFYNSCENKIFVARYVKFFENSLTLREASGSNVDLEINQEENTQPSENTRLQHNEVKHMDVEPHGEIVPICRPNRIPRVHNQYGCYVDAKKHELGNLNKPPNYKAAFSDLKSDKWVEAKNAKIQSMKDNQVWRLVNLPPDGSIVRNKWIFKKNTYMNGKVHTFKARLIAKENSKRRNIPMQEKPNLSKAQGASKPEEVKRMQRVLYALAIGPIMNSKDMVLVYEGNPEDELRVTCYTVAGFQINKDDTKSQSRYFFVLNGGVID
ncbi:retrotransposon protein, putative, ty1-copia subclass [Tanacetum coccineum]